MGGRTYGVKYVDCNRYCRVFTITLHSIKKGELSVPFFFILGVDIVSKTSII